MLRKIIAGTAVAGALTFGAAGIAGAAAPTTPSTPSGGSSGAQLSTLCAKLPKAEARVRQMEAALASRLPKAQAREAKLMREHKTTQAEKLADRIAKMENREKQVNVRLAKLEAKCGTGSTGSTGATGAAA
jgi:uncharacterized protein (DUF342 family)